MTWCSTNSNILIPRYLIYVRVIVVVVHLVVRRAAPAAHRPGAARAAAPARRCACPASRSSCRARCPSRVRYRCCRRARPRACPGTCPRCPAALQPAEHPTASPQRPADQSYHAAHVHHAAARLANQVGIRCIFLNWL